MGNKISNNQGKKKALIIAISDYDNLPQEKQLPFCKNDGKAIYQILQNQGFEIPNDWNLIGRVTSDQLKKAIFDFFRKRAESKDTLLFYFSGHGVPDGHGGHYLASSDIETDLPDYYGFKFTDIEDQANKSLAKKIITILDCCFSGAAGVKGDEEDLAKSARSDMDRTFKEGDGKCVLASSLAGQVSYKKKGEPYSLFTYYLLEGLKGGKGAAVNLEGYVTPTTLGSYVYYGITSEDKRQKPITKTSTSGDIVLAYYPQLIERQEKVLVRTSGLPSSSSSSKSNDDLRPLLDSARKYYVRREYKKADIFFERVLEIEPNHIEALNSKGISLYRLEEYDKAKACFNKVLEIDPENIVALNTVEILGKKKDDSSQQLERPISSSSSDDSKTNQGADPRNPYNDPTLPYYNPLLDEKKISDDAGSWYDRGLALAKSNKHEEAIRYYDKALEIDPKLSSAWNNKGNSLRILGKYEEAIACLDKALEIDPEHLYAWNNKGASLLGLGKYEEAIACLDKALEIDPKLSIAWNNKGGSLYKLAKYEEAIACLDKALEIDPNYANAWYNKGNNLRVLGRLEEAIVCYDTTIKLSPNYFSAWYMKGIVLSHLSRYEEAIRCLDNAINLNPNFGETYYHRGLALHKLGKKNDAETSLKKAKDLGYKP